MNAMDEFTATWTSRFPEDAVPSFAGVIGGFPDRGERVSAVAAQVCLDEHRERVSALKKELEQEELIVSLLASVVAKISTNSDLSRADSLCECRMSQSEGLPVVRNRPSPMPRLGSSSKPGKQAGVAASKPPPLPNNNSDRRTSLPVPDNSSGKDDARFSDCQFTSFGARRAMSYTTAQLEEVRQGTPSECLPAQSAAVGASEGGGQDDHRSSSTSYEAPVYANSESLLLGDMGSESRPGSVAGPLEGGSGSQRFHDYAEVTIPPPFEDSSASSIGSSGATHSDLSRARSAGSSKLVKVNYDLPLGNAPPPPMPYSLERTTSAVSATDYPERYDSDEDDQDDEPQYVRLVLDQAGRIPESSGSVEDLSLHSSESDVISEDGDSLGRTDSLSQSERSGDYQPQFDNLIYANPVGLAGIPCAPPSPVTPNDQSDTPLHPLPEPPLPLVAPAPPSPEPKVKRSSTDEEKLRFRKILIGKLVEDEQAYVTDLESVLAFCKNLLANSEGTQPILPKEHVLSIFGNLHEVHVMHSNFLDKLRPVYKHWTDESSIGEIFKILATHLPCYSKYVEKYPVALNTLRHCMQLFPKFRELASVGFKTRSRGTALQLEEILLIPVHKVQRISLLFHDILSHTPSDHVDYDMLSKALKVLRGILENLSITQHGSNEFQNRYLIKNSFIVELTSGNARKLRQVFLFSDMLICGRTRPANRRFDVKWVIPLTELVLPDKLDDQLVDFKHAEKKTKKEIEQKKKQVRTLKSDLRTELKNVGKEEDISKNSKVNRIKKRLQDHEAALILLEPRLKFGVSNTRGGCYTLLMSSDYERMDWLDTTRTHQARAMAINPNRPKVLLSDAQTILDDYTDKGSVKVNSMEANVLKEAKDEDIINGLLIVSIHEILGLTDKCTALVAMEVDSFGHFLHKAKTKCITATCCDQEDFEIELESSSTLRFLCYQRTDKGDRLLARSALDLSKSWLRQGFKNKQVSMNELTLVVSIRYRNADQTILRNPSKVSTGMFGVKLASCVKKDKSIFPLFVKACVEEVEKRGMDELGIYRVSGTTSDILRIKKAFDKNVKVGCELVSDIDINAVTGALKLYFRELPEALFTDELYPSLLEANRTEDDTKKRLMVEYFASLPPSNFHTCLFLLNHLVRVANRSHENKMPLQNLATVFGPTLLKPAKKAAEQPGPTDLFTMGATDAMNQAAILHCYLMLAAGGLLTR